MKTILNKILLITLCIFAFGFNAKSQTNLTIDPSQTLNGYMNVFDLSYNYMFGGPWALPDMKTTFSGSNIILEPNYNTYDAADPYWANGTIGNKIMEGNSYYETTSLGGQTINFSGSVLANTLSSGYTANAFIKVLDPNNGYATVLYQPVAIPATGGLYYVTATIPATPGLIVQYGFNVIGLNANPANAATIGSITLAPAFPTPLDLAHFNALYKNKNVELNWLTYNESLVNHFEIEKSIDGKNFRTIGSVMAKNGVENNYTYYDNNNINNVVYYRLKMIDQDGKYKFSTISKVNVPNVMDVYVFPNPTKNTLNIHATNIFDYSKATIYNSFGLKMKEIVMQNNDEKLDISSYSMGTYFIKFSNNEVLTFVKN